MALPFSRNTTYVASSTPSIKAQDLLDLQDYLGGLYSATKSIIGLKIDGVGNNGGPASPAQLDVGQSALSDVAVAIFRDQLGHARSVFDHLGLPAGRRSEFRENWEFSILVNAILAQAPIFSSGFSRWYATTTNGTRNRIQTVIGGIGAAGSFIQPFFNAATGGDLSILYGGFPWVKPQTYSSIVMEFEIQLATPLNTTTFCGLTGFNNGGGVAPANATPWFGLAQKDVLGVNWQLLHGDGTTLVYTDLGVARDALVHQVRLEHHGSGSPYGTCVRLFLDGVQLGGNITTNIPTAATMAANDGLTPQFGLQATNTSSASISVGPVSVTYNRVALSSPSL